MADKLGNRLRKMREKRGLSIEELSRETGISYGAIIALEHGKTKNPTLQTALALAKFFGVPVEQFFVGKE